MFQSRSQAMTSSLLLLCMRQYVIISDLLSCVSMFSLRMRKKVDN